MCETSLTPPFFFFFLQHRTERRSKNGEVGVSSWFEQVDALQVLSFLPFLSSPLSKKNFSKKVDSVLGDILNGLEEVVNEPEPSNEQMEIAEAMLKSLQGLFFPLSRQKKKLHQTIPLSPPPFLMNCFSQKNLGIFSKVGGTMNHSTLVSSGSRLKSVLLALERERNPKPQTIVLIGNNVFLFRF